MRFRAAFILGALLVVATSNSLFAQGFQGGLPGSVTDAGCVVPGVEVTLDNEQTDITRSPATNERGECVFANVAPDGYGVKAALQGYTTGASRVRAADDKEQTARPLLQTPFERPAPLRPLYISFAALQVLDVHFTKMALGSNPQASEANPIMGSVVGSTVGMITLKTTAAVGIYYMSERLWKQNRRAAIWTMIGLNVGYGLVVAHNYRVASSGTPGR